MTYIIISFAVGLLIGFRIGFIFGEIQTLGNINEVNRTGDIEKFKSKYNIK